MKATPVVFAAALLASAPRVAWTPDVPCVPATPCVAHPATGRPPKARTAIPGQRRAFFAGPWHYATATWYRPKLAHVRQWGRVDGKALLAAHRHVRPGGIVEVQNVANGKRVVVRIVGYGPARYTGNDIDLARDAMRAIGRGKIRVRYRVRYHSRWNWSMEEQWRMLLN